MQVHTPVAPSRGTINLTHLIYALHAVSVATGVIGAATVVGMMVTGWPSLLAVILNYLKRDDVRGTWLESHFRWQIRTFWFAMAWGCLALLLIVSVVGIVIGIPLLFLVGVWIVYRVVRGWLKLVAGKPIPGFDSAKGAGAAS